MRPLESFGKEEEESFIKEEVAPVIVAETGEGFVIEELEMSGFMRYVDRTDPPLRFPEKFTVITGKTGSGKTSILDAITFALYKRTSRTDISGIKITDIVKNGGHVKLVFHQAGNRYEVRRGVATNGSTYLELYKDGNLIGGKIPELEAIIKDIIGLDYDGFRNSTFVRQEEMKELGAESGSKRLEIFQKLFRLETFEKAQELAKKKFREARREIETSEREMLVRREGTAKLPEFKEDLKERQEKFDFGKEKLDNVKKELLVADEKFKRSENDHEDYVKLVDQIENKKRTIEDLIQKIERKELESKDSKELKGKVKTLEKDVKNYDKLVAEREKLTKLEQKSASLKKQLELHNNQKGNIESEFQEKVASFNKRVKEQRERIASLSTDIGEEEAFGLLRKEGSLTERIDRIKKEIDWLKNQKDIIDTIKTERTEAEKELKAVTEKVSGISKDSFVLTEIEENVSDMRGLIEEEKKRRDESAFKIEQDIEGLTEEVGKVGFDEKKEQRLGEIAPQIDELQDKKEELEDARAGLEKMGDVTKLLEELNSQKEKEEKALKEAEEREKEKKVAEEKYEKNREKLEELRTKEKGLDRDIHGMKVKIEELQKRITELEADTKKLADVEKETEELRAKSEVYSILKDNILHRKGVVMYAINQLLPTLEIETSQNLSELTDGRFSRVQLRTHEEDRGYGVKIEVEGPDAKWHDVAEFSGGERTQINAALRFAIAKELASMPQVGRTYGRMKTLFIDEGDLGSLDTETNRDLFVQKLFNMGEFFDKIILITHLVEVADRFQGQIRINMTPEQESRIEVIR
ncbi:MAG: SMC family ATPase [Thermoplasmata archaeon]|nr:SMC family ATPase [Thermoplasmata archaeon]